ncbi:15382_t:CDS:2, partial [Funneliformis mosseae]
YIKPSDIYSYGILMWKISSGYPPFKDLNDATIYAIISNKACKKAILDTPKDYKKLYKNLNNKVKVIHFDELIDLKPLDEGGFGSIIKVTWSKATNYAVLIALYVSWVLVK